MDPPTAPKSRIAARDQRSGALEEIAAAGVPIVEAANAQEKVDWVVVEEPLEIRAGGPGQDPVSVAVTMRTPGHDRELAVGFLYTEGLLSTRDDLTSIVAAQPRRAAPSCNVVHVLFSRPFDDSVLKRNFFATSSCGVCGKASLDQVTVRCAPAAPGPSVQASMLTKLPGTLRAAQAVFARTGGLHAAGVFDSNGRLRMLREDVGRHNAVDKVIGRAFLDGDVPLADCLLLVSGRASFEIVQKAAVAGIPIVCAVSAPSSLAVSLAERLNITLVGFLRGSNFNIYAHPRRIDLSR